ncbi:hypothetical protein [Azospirillum soli]|uniref:hypothetical protein n=1 Tax=Azospirillum soli TaxID=1304799 RepID=UPI001AE307F0|nr:hypothetical protein [Azospirillum soli]MBP2315051.1 hypothetical protein [Azospirillum soli]
MGADKTNSQRDLGIPNSEEAGRDGSVENPTPGTGGGGIDPAALGGPATPAIGEDGAQAGGGPHVGATEGGTQGVLDLGTSATAGPTRGTDDRDRPQPQPGQDGRFTDDRNVAVDGARDKE